MHCTQQNELSEYHVVGGGGGSMHARNVVGGCRGGAAVDRACSMGPVQLHGDPASCGYMHGSLHVFNWAG